MKNIASNIIPENHIARIILATAAVLLVPLVAMQLSDEVSWTFSDFIVIAVLLVGAGLAYEYFARKSHSTKQRIIIGLAVAVVVAIVWVQLAVGIVASPFSGS